MKTPTKNRRLGLALLLVVAACAGPSQNGPVATPHGGCQEGDISYYAPRFDGRRTASGEAYRHDGLTAAHRTLPFGTEVDVHVGETNVRLRINDRGPYAHHRILDVSGKAAQLLHLEQRGHARGKVCIARLPR